MKILLTLAGVFIFSVLTWATTSNSFAKKYHSLFLQERKKGANFAEHYRLVQIGCGSGCSLIGILDMNSTRAYDPDLFVTDAVKNSHSAARVEFSVEKKDFILRGCLNEKSDQCGTHKFTWTGEKVLKTESVLDAQSH